VGVADDAGHGDLGVTQARAAGDHELGVPAELIHRGPPAPHQQVDRVACDEAVTARGALELRVHALLGDAERNAEDGEAATDGFAAGDVVELCEIGSYATTVTREQFTVVSATATTVTLSSAPSAPMIALAATAYRVMLRYAGHGDVIAAQYPYAYLADTTPDLTDGSVDRWAP
jgi:hypothetical protein